MVLNGETMAIEHGAPKRVDPPEIEEELERLTNEPQESGERRAFARALTLIIYCEQADDSEAIDNLVGEIITRSSARAIVLWANAEAAEHGFEAWIRTHCLSRGGEEVQLCTEQITLHARGPAAQNLHGLALSLRLGNLPVVLWWRGQPDPDNPLFLELLRSADQVILDSAHFGLPAQQFGPLVARLRRANQEASFGDINWARLMPWRELIAQFFDTPAHLEYLARLNEITLDYSARAGGNSAQAILLTMWMATNLNWQAVSGSWERNGRDRSLRLRDKEREIQVAIRGREDTPAPPGGLTAVRLHAKDEPEAAFYIEWADEKCAKTRVELGGKVVERSVALFVPGEVSLVCSELEAPHHDRVYHRALQVLEQLLT